MSGKHSLKLWAFEIAFLSVSIFSVAAIGGCCVFYNGKQIVKSRLPITLNVIVSALSTLSAASLMTVVESCISQGNWILFSDSPRRLYDFEIIAEASRGPWGSFRILLSRSVRGAGLVRLGALTTVLTIFLNPFAQQLVQPREIVERVELETGFPSASRYSRGVYETVSMVQLTVTDNGHVKIMPDVAVHSDADFIMQSAAYFGLAAEYKAITHQALSGCDADACEFEDINSLAVCSKCTDLTGQLKKSKDSSGSQYSDLKLDGSWAEAGANSTEYQLPNGLTLNNIDGKYGDDNYMVYMTMKGTSNPNDTVAMMDLDTLIWSQSMIKVDAEHGVNSTRKWPNFDVYASECALYYCVQRYNASTRSGLFNLSSTILEDEKRLESSWQPLDLLDSMKNVSAEVLNSISYHPQDSIIYHSDLQLGHQGSEKTWNVSQTAINGIGHFMQRTFAACRNGANCTDTLPLEQWDIPNGFYIHGIGKNQDEYQPSLAKTLFEAESLDGLFYNVASSMSNALRAGDDTSQQVKGERLFLITVYNVTWPWLLLHCAVEISGLVFLMLTIKSARRNRDIPVWKSSELAVFSRGALVGDKFKDNETAEELTDRAKKTKVVLVGRYDQDMETLRPKTLETESYEMGSVSINSFEDRAGT